MVGKLIDRWIASRTRKLQAKQKAEQQAKYQQTVGLCKEFFMDKSTLMKQLNTPPSNEEVRINSPERIKDRIQNWNTAIKNQGCEIGAPVARRRSPFIKRTEEGLIYDRKALDEAAKRMRDPFVDKYVDDAKKALTALSNHFKSKKDVGGQAIVGHWLKQVREWEATYSPAFGDEADALDSVLLK